MADNTRKSASVFALTVSEVKYATKMCSCALVVTATTVEFGSTVVGFGAGCGVDEDIGVPVAVSGVIGFQPNHALTISALC